MRHLNCSIVDAEVYYTSANHMVQFVRVRQRPGRQSSGRGMRLGVFAIFQESSPNHSCECMYVVSCEKSPTHLLFYVIFLVVLVCGMSQRIHMSILPELALELDRGSST